MAYAEKVLQPGESVAYRAQLHWIVYLSGLMPLALGLIWSIFSFVMYQSQLRSIMLLIALILVFVGIFQSLRAWLVVANTEIFVTSKRIIMKTGFIAISSLEMNIDKVESVLVNQGLLGRLMDFGTVTVRGVGSGLEPMANVAAPLELRNHIGAAP
jgi:uncharacterized membrane protein YdbT with pleckstrin-like domain